MNEDYENEEVNEEEDYESSSNYDVPPSSNNPFYNFRNKLKQKTSNLKKNAFGTLMGALKGAVTFFISNPILLGVILFFVIIAMIWLVISEETAKKVSNSVDKYISSAEDMDPTAKALYETRHSLILLKLSEINDMYDKFIKDRGVSGDIRTAMKTKVGKNEVEKQKAGLYDSESYVLEGYEKQFKAGSDGVRDDERVKIITGATAPISSYKVGGKYSLVNGQIGGCPVEIVDITIPVWKSSGSGKVASTTNLQVNSKIKGIVQSIFQDIYNDPSQPVINEIGCFRSGDAYPNHPFGTGIDINPSSNPQIKAGNNVGGPYRPGSDPLSMDANHPIVKIFTQKYGWDWGGSWRSYQDYMHFSFMGG